MVLDQTAVRTHAMPHLNPAYKP